MSPALAAILGIVVGGLGGLALGVGIGLAYVDLFDVSCFEGLCGYVVAFIFAPLGLVIGAAVAGTLLHRWARRRRKGAPLSS